MKKQVQRQIQRRQASLFSASPSLSTDEEAPQPYSGHNFSQVSIHYTAPTETHAEETGQPLDEATRSLMEPRFGHDFSQVRIHTDERAAKSARTVDASAYTVGQNVVFGAGQYTPGTGDGQRLLAHELAHVIQQERGGAAPPPLQGGTLEQAADSAASAFVAGSESIHVDGESAPGVARQPAPGSPDTVPPYLQDIDRRLRQMVDKDVKFFAEEIAPVEELRRKYPESPLREDAILDIPALNFDSPTDISVDSPQGRFQLHSLLPGGYELLDYHPPDVIIARDGVGYLLNDEIFAWKFGEDLPEFYETSEGQLIFRHEHPLQALFADIGMSAFPLPLDPQHMLGFIAMFLMPILPGFSEIGAVPGEMPSMEPESGLPPQTDQAAASPAGTMKGDADPWVSASPDTPPAVEPAVPNAILPNGKAIPPDSFGGGYYGTADIPPDVALTDGLPARGNDWKLLDHAMENPDSAFRGTTTLPSDPIREQGAAYWAGEGGYVYEIRGVPTWDVNRALQGRVQTPEGYGGNLMHGENEYAIPARVTADKIVRYGVVKKDSMGRLFVEWVTQ